ncbi:MAG: hypothetical protein ABSG94_01330 [Brevinematales bacterium]
MIESKKTAFFMSCLAVILLFCLFSRGFFELAGLSKKSGYIIVFIAMIVIMIPVFISFLKNGKPSGLFFAFPVSAYAAVVFLSALFTALKYGIYIEPFIFSILILFIFFAFLMISLVRTGPDFSPGIAFNALFVIASVLFVSSLWEQSAWFPFLTRDDLGNVTRGFPGHSFISAAVRPASLTGSYLHYPVIIPVLGAVIMRFGGKWQKIAGALFFIAPLIAVSRSGMLITILAFLLYAAYLSLKLFAGWLRKPDKNISFKKLAPVIAGVLSVILCIILLYIFVPAVKGQAGMLCARMTDLKDSGNLNRYKTWSGIVHRYLKTNLILGELTGFYTNITGNVTGNKSILLLNGGIIVAESGFLEILTSFGILGVIVFYGTMAGLYFRVFFSRREMFLGFVFIACVLQTFFYQSVEVLPFMAALAFSAYFVNNKPSEGFHAR